MEGKKCDKGLYSKVDKDHIEGLPDVAELLLDLTDRLKIGRPVEGITAELKELREEVSRFYIYNIIRRIFHHQEQYVP
jgi:hypothetical protein